MINNGFANFYFVLSFSRLTKINLHTFSSVIVWLNNHRVIHVSLLKATKKLPMFQFHKSVNKKQIKTTLYFNGPSVGLCTTVLMEICFK